MTEFAEAEKHQALSSSPGFHCLTHDELRSLMVLATARTYDAGEIIIADGDDSEDIFVIASGAAAVFKNGSHISYVRKGDIVGEMALISGRPRSATVIMAKRGAVLRLPHEVYAELIERHPEMWRDLCYMVSARLCETTGLRSARETSRHMV